MIIAKKIPKSRIHQWRNIIAVCLGPFLSLCSARAEHTTIEILHYFGVEDQQKALSEIVTAFEQSNPDIKIQLTYVPFGELLSRTLQTAAVHRPAAIAALDNPDVLRAAKAGVLEDISPRLSQIPAWKETYGGPKSAISAGGHVYGIPIGSNTVALYYNKKMFAEAGIQGPPKTWDDLLRIAKQLSKPPVYGIAFPAINTEDCTGTWEAFLWTNGGSLLDLGSENARQALKLWADLVQDGSASPDVVTWSGGDVANQFIGGTAAMMVSGPWMLLAVKRSGVDYGIVPIPIRTVGQKPVVALGGEVWCVMKTNRNTEDAALRFIAFTQNPERLLKLCMTCDYISSVAPVAQNQGRLQPDLQPFVVEMETARARSSEGGAEYPLVSQITRTAIQKVLAGQGSIDGSLREAATEIAKLDIKK